MGVGYLPIAPGTFGSAVGLLIWYVLPVSLLAQGAAIAAVSVIGAWSGTIAERQYARVDPGYVVIDEVAGMLVTLFLVPVGWAGATGGFLLFRLFDIVKPYPANRLERLHGGLGIMADDIMAGVYANLALRLCIWSFGHLVI
jgi:phosphatidylglycerophosphatase A